MKSAKSFHNNRKSLNIIINFLLIVISQTFIINKIKLVETLDNGLALTPPMGWLAWERFVCELDCDLYPNECINQNLFEEMANHLVDDGFKQAGYEYINIDDCWSKKERNNLTGELEPDLKRFPSIIELSQHVHSLGLKLGIYGDCGTKTCQLFPGQLKYSTNLTDNYYKLDANLFSKWQIDSFKFDGCNMEVKKASELCPSMGDALNSTNRKILFSCSWPAYEYDEKLKTNWSLVVEKCNLWRSFGDIEDSWKSVLETIDYFVKEQDTVLRYHGPGHWFDADQLIIGDFGLSYEQEKSQMAIWSIWASPLYMSNDLRLLNKESSKILKNKYVISINQDRLGIFGMMIKSTRDIQVFIKPIEPILTNCPSYAIVYFDRRTLGSGKLISFKLSSLIESLHEKLNLIEKWSKLWSNCPFRKSNITYSVYDLYNNFAKIESNLNLINDNLILRVNPSGVRMVELIQNVDDNNNNNI